jgi:hypothetical protein
MANMIVLYVGIKAQLFYRYKYKEREKEKTIIKTAS